MKIQRCGESGGSKVGRGTAERVSNSDGTPTECLGLVLVHFDVPFALER